MKVFHEAFLRYPLEGPCLRWENSHPNQDFFLLERIASFTHKEKNMANKNTFWRGRTSVEKKYKDWQLKPILTLGTGTLPKGIYSPLPEETFANICEWNSIFSMEMDVSQNSGFSPQIIHFNRFFQYFHHPFWGTRTFGNTQMMFVQLPCFPFFKNFQHQEGHTSNPPTLLSLKKGIQERSQVTATFFQLATPSKRKSCIFHHSVSEIFIFQFHQLHHLLLQPPSSLSFSVGVESSHFRGGKSDVEELTLDLFVGQVKPLTHVVWLDSLDLSQCGAPKWWRVMEVETFLSFWKF